MLKWLLGQRFGKRISRLISRVNMNTIEFVMLDLARDKMEVNGNVLHAAMKDKIWQR